MGLLKHAILPFLALMEASVVFMYFTGNSNKVVELAEMPGAENERTAIEKHLMGMSFGALPAVLVFGCLVGIFYENAHFRGIVMSMHVIVYAIDTLNNWYLGDEGFDYRAPGGMFLLCLIGLIVHSQEPGLLTTDKTKNQEKQQ